jgi:hypothetical protein
MRLAILISTMIAILVAPAAPALAWWDEGHMQIAYVAYKQLDARSERRPMPCSR